MLISKPSIADYIQLCKPRVVALMLLTSIIAMLLVLSPSTMIPLNLIFFGVLGIALAAGAGGVINHYVDRRIDEIMARTKNRPLPSGRIKPTAALFFAGFLTVSSMLILF